MSISELLNQTLSSIVQIEDDLLIFRTQDGVEYKMYHAQNCCEHVYIESIVGDLNDLLNNPILVAEEATNDSPAPEDCVDECNQWTFYKLATIKGHVDIRWFGSSNGYYSVDVDFYKVVN